MQCKKFPYSYYDRNLLFHMFQCPKYLEIEKMKQIIYTVEYLRYFQREKETIIVEKEETEEKLLANVYVVRGKNRFGKRLKTIRLVFLK